MRSKPRRFDLVLGTFELFLEVLRLDDLLVLTDHTAAGHDKVERVGVVNKVVINGARAAELLVRLVELDMCFRELVVVIGLRFHLALGTVDVRLLELAFEFLEFVCLVALLDHEHELLVLASRSHLQIDVVEFRLNGRDLAFDIIDIGGDFHCDERDVARRSGQIVAYRLSLGNRLFGVVLVALTRRFEQFKLDIADNVIFGGNDFLERDLVILDEIVGFASMRIKLDIKLGLALGRLGDFLVKLGQSRVVIGDLHIQVAYHAEIGRGKDLRVRGGDCGFERIAFFLLRLGIGVELLDLVTDVVDLLEERRKRSDFRFEFLTGTNLREPHLVIVEFRLRFIACGDKTFHKRVAFGLLFAEFFEYRVESFATADKRFKLGAQFFEFLRVALLLLLFNTEVARDSRFVFVLRGCELELEILDILGVLRVVFFRFRYALAEFVLHRLRFVVLGLRLFGTIFKLRKLFLQYVESVQYVFESLFFGRSVDVDLLLGELVASDLGFDVERRIGIEVEHKLFDLRFFFRGRGRRRGRRTALRLFRYLALAHDSLVHGHGLLVTLYNALLLFFEFARLRIFRLEERAAHHAFRLVLLGEYAFEKLVVGDILGDKLVQTFVAVGRHGGLRLAHCGLTSRHGHGRSRTGLRLNAGRELQSIGRRRGGRSRTRTEKHLTRLRECRSLCGALLCLISRNRRIELDDIRRNGSLRRRFFLPTSADRADKQPYYEQYDYKSAEACARDYQSRFPILETREETSRVDVDVDGFGIKGDLLILVVGESEGDRDLLLARQVFDLRRELENVVLVFDEQKPRIGGLRTREHVPEIAQRRKPLVGERVIRHGAFARQRREFYRVPAVRRDRDRDIERVDLFDSRFGVYYLITHGEHDRMTAVGNARRAFSRRNDIRERNVARRVFAGTKLADDRQTLVLLRIGVADLLAVEQYFRMEERHGGIVVGEHVLDEIARRNANGLLIGRGILDRRGRIFRRKIGILLRRQIVHVVRA